MTNQRYIIKNKHLQMLLRKNSGTIHFKEFKAELSRLLINEDYEIIDIEEYDNMKARIEANTKNSISNGAYRKMQHIEFTRKKTLNIIINIIGSSYDKSIYMSTGYSDICGIVKINNLSSFNTNFNFFDERSGLIVFYDILLQNKMMLDFYEEDDMFFYDIEVFGNDWIDLIENHGYSISFT